MKKSIFSIFLCLSVAICSVVESSDDGVQAVAQNKDLSGVFKDNILAYTPIAISANGNVVWVAYNGNEDKSYFYEITDPTTHIGEFTGQTIKGLTLSENGSIGYVLTMHMNGTYSLWKYESNNLKSLIYLIPNLTYNIRSIACSSDGSNAYLFTRKGDALITHTRGNGEIEIDPNNIHVNCYISLATVDGDKMYIFSENWAGVMDPFCTVYDMKGNQQGKTTLKSGDYPTISSKGVYIGKYIVYIAGEKTSCSSSDTFLVSLNRNDFVSGKTINVDNGSVQ